MIDAVKVKRLSSHHVPSVRIRCHQPSSPFSARRVFALTLRQLSTHREKQLTKSDATGSSETDQSREPLPLNPFGGCRRAEPVRNSI
jgi:hypothetical protein